MTISINQVNANRFAFSRYISLDLFGLARNVSGYCRKAKSGSRIANCLKISHIHITQLTQDTEHFISLRWYFIFVTPELVNWTKKCLNELIQFYNDQKFIFHNLIRDHMFITILSI